MTTAYADLLKPHVGAVVFDQAEGKPSPDKHVRWFAIERIEDGIAYELGGGSHKCADLVTSFLLFNVSKKMAFTMTYEEVVMVNALLQELAYAISIMDEARIADANSVFDSGATDALRVAWPLCSPPVKKLVTDYRRAQKAAA